MPPLHIVFVRIEGLSSVHAVRAAHTALSSVVGISRAEVTRFGARVEHDGRATRAAIDAALAVAGLSASGWEDQGRVLPVMDGRDEDHGSPR